MGCGETETRTVNGKERTETVEVLARKDGWTVVHRPSSGSLDWRSIRVEREGGDEKRCKRRWYLEWNGQRLALGPEPASLEDAHPTIYAWVVEALEALPFASLALKPRGVIEWAVLHRDPDEPQALRDLREQALALVNEIRRQNRAWLIEKPLWPSEVEHGTR